MICDFIPLSHLISDILFALILAIGTCLKSEIANVQCANLAKGVDG